MKEKSPPAATESYLDSAEAAAHLRISVKYLLELANANVFRGWCMGNAWSFSRAMLDEDFAKLVRQQVEERAMKRLALGDAKPEPSRGPNASGKARKALVSFE